MRPRTDHDVENIIGKRILDGMVQYRVHWLNRSSHDLWEPITNLESCTELLREYDRTSDDDNLVWQPPPTTIIDHFDGHNGKVEYRVRFEDGTIKNVEYTFGAMRQLIAEYNKKLEKKDPTFMPRQSFQNKKKKTKKTSSIVGNSTPRSTGTKASTSTKASSVTKASDNDLLSIIDTNQKIVEKLDKSTNMRDYIKSELAERKLMDAMKELQRRAGCYLPQKRHVKFNGTQSQEINISIERCLNDPENFNIADEILAIKNHKLRADVVEKINELRSKDLALEQHMFDTSYFDPEHENIDDHLFERNKTVCSSHKDNGDAAKVPPTRKRIKTKHERIVEYSHSVSEPVQSNVIVADTPEHEILVPMDIQIEPVQSNVPDTVRKFHCLKCGSSYTYKRDLTRHNIESHINTEKYRCDECKVDFKYKRNFMTHNKAKHSKATQ